MKGQLASPEALSRRWAHRTKVEVGPTATTFLDLLLAAVPLTALNTRSGSLKYTRTNSHELEPYEIMQPLMSIDGNCLEHELGIDMRHDARPFGKAAKLLSCISVTRIHL